MLAWAESPPVNGWAWVTLRPTDMVVRTARSGIGNYIAPSMMRENALNLPLFIAYR